MQKTLQDLHISHEWNESENIPILVEERWDAFRASPRLDAWDSLKIFTWGDLGIPKLELLPLFIFLISRPPRSNTSSTQNFNRKLGKIRYYNKANHYSKYCCKPIHIFFLHYSYCNITFPWLNPLIGIDSFIKTSKLCIKNRICLKQDSL